MIKYQAFIMVRKILQRFSGLLQDSTDSYKRHNAQYEESGKIEIERREGATKIQNDTINGPSMRIRDLLEQHPLIRTAVDIGSGTGWSSAALSPIIATVIGIEPSAQAVVLSKTIYPAEKYPNITWMHGLAEDVLPTLSLTTPCLFFTGCVLSHIRDEEVQKICTAVTLAVPPGSVLSFDECWGDTPWHQMMWHVRTKEWWQQQLPGWTLDFHGPVVPEKDAYKGIYHKGFWGMKR